MARLRAQLEACQAELAAEQGTSAALLERVDGLEAEQRERRARSEAEQLIALRLRLAASRKQLERARAEMSEMSARMVALASELSSARAVTETERQRHAQELAESRAGHALAAAWWRKRTQLATVQAIMHDRKVVAETERCEGLEVELEQMRNSSTQLQQLDSQRRQALMQVEALRFELSEAHEPVVEARGIAEQLHAELAARTAAHEAALAQIGELKDELRHALPLVGWKQQAEDVLRRDEHLAADLAAAATRVHEFEAKVAALVEQRRQLPASSGASPADPHEASLLRMGESERARADAIKWEAVHPSPHPDDALMAP